MGIDQSGPLHALSADHQTRYILSLLSRIISLQRTNLKHSRASRNGVVSDGRVAAGQNGVRLARDGRGAVGCCWDGDGETSGDGRCAAKKSINLC